MRLLKINNYQIQKWAVILALSSVFLLGQDKRLRLKKADVLERVTMDGKAVQYLKGNVVFQKGEMIMNCDWARFNQKTEQGFLFGNVTMVKNEQNLICDSLFVDSPKNIMIAYSNCLLYTSPSPRD